MTDRFNTIAGWVLFSGIVALGLSILSGMYFKADKHHEVKEVYIIEGGGDEGAADGPSLASLLAVADPVKGEAVFAKCMSCHTIDQGGANGIGPNLYGVVGEKAAEGRGGFAFSDGLKAKGGEWTFENLDAWLKNPRAYADGTKMSFAGLSSAEDRANVIAFLNSKGSNLPLPAVEAAAPVEDSSEAAEDAATSEATPAAGGANQNAAVAQ